MISRVSQAVSDESDPVLALAASYRHGILNHLQVLLGWLQLGQPHRAAEHIRVLQEGMLGETRLVRGAAPRAASVLLMRRTCAEQHGIELDFRVPESLRGYTWPREVPDELVAGLIDASILLLDGAPAGRRLDLILGEEGGFRHLTLRLEAAEANEEELLAAMEQLPEAPGYPAAPREMLQSLADAGASWGCYQEGPVGVIRLSWPGDTADGPFPLGL